MKKFIFLVVFVFLAVFVGSFIYSRFFVTPASPVLPSEVPTLEKSARFSDFTSGSVSFSVQNISLPSSLPVYSVEFSDDSLLQTLSSLATFLGFTNSSFSSSEYGFILEDQRGVMVYNPELRSVSFSNNVNQPPLVASPESILNKAKQLELIHKDVSFSLLYNRPFSTAGGTKNPESVFVSEYSFLFNSFPLVFDPEQPVMFSYQQTADGNVISFMLRVFPKSVSLLEQRQVVRSVDLPQLLQSSLLVDVRDRSNPDEFRVIPSFSSFAVSSSKIQYSLFSENGRSFLFPVLSVDGVSTDGSNLSGVFSVRITK